MPTTAKTNWDSLDVGIVFDGRVITLPDTPERMPIPKAVSALQRLEADENQEFQVHETIDAYPLDAAVACTRAMTKLYGWASPQTEIIHTMFGRQENPPRMLSVKIGLRDEDVVQCPLGDFRLPGLDSKVSTAIYSPSGGGGPIFVIHAKVKKKDRHVVLELATETRRLVREASIYKGKVIRLGVDDDGDLDTDNPPTFLDVTDTTEAAVLFDEEIVDQIDTNMLVPIKHTPRCRELGIPLKRTGLFEGPFGTGKSLTARMIANVAERHGWTFVLLDKVQGLRAALEFAKRYAPAVVFAEDIDRIYSVFDVSRDPPVEYRDAMPETNFKREFSFGPGKQDSWTWHDKTPFPWDRVIENMFPDGPRFASAEGQLSAAERVAQRMRLRGRAFDRDDNAHRHDQSMSRVHTVLDSIRRALDTLRP